MEEIDVLGVMEAATHMAYAFGERCEYPRCTSPDPIRLGAHRKEVREAVEWAARRAVLDGVIAEHKRLCLDPASCDRLRELERERDALAEPQEEASPAKCDHGWDESLIESRPEGGVICRKCGAEGLVYR